MILTSYSKTSRNTKFGFELHQNNYSKDFISVLISVDKSDESNACLQFDISGNNHRELKGKIFQPLKIKSLKKPKFISIKMNSGDVCFFNSYIPHRSSKNISNKKMIIFY